MTEAVFEPGDVVVMPGEFIGIVKYPADERDRQAAPAGRLPLVRTRVQPLAEACRKAAEAGDLDPGLCNTECTRTGRMSGASRSGFTVLCRCTSSWGNGRQVITPCCGRVRRVTSEHSQMVTCPGCRWFWRLLLGPGLQTRWVSYGFGRNLRR